jgi:hypothetical protein
VNQAFGTAVSNNARFMFFGGGVHVPVRDRLSLFADARMQVGVEGGELLGMVPVRVGIGWRF